MENSKEKSVQKILVGYGVRDGIREMTLEQYREQITSRFTQNKVEALRRCEDEQQREALKRNSFYILPQGRIKETRRLYALGVQPTKENIEYRPDVQMLDLDIRPEDCPTAWDAYMKHVNNYLIELGIPLWPRVAMVSVSGKGFHMYVRLSEKQQAMDRKELVQAFGRVFGLEFDLSTIDPTRRAFQSHEFLTPTDDEALGLLFGRPLTEEEQRCLDEMDRLMEEATEQPAIADRMQPATPRCVIPSICEGSLTPYREGTSSSTAPCHPEQREGSLTKNLLELPEDVALTDVVETVVKAVCGKEDGPVEGERNETIYKATKELSYISGITKDDLVEAFAELGFYGLGKEEVSSAVSSGLKHDKFWEMKPSPILSEAVASLTPQPKSPKGELEGINHHPSTINLQPSTLTIPTRLTQCPAMPKLPPLLQLIASRVPEHCRASAVQSCFSALGVYLSNEAYIRGLDNTPRRFQFSECVAGETSSGKDYLPRLSEAIMKRRIAHDNEVYAALDAWREVCQITPRTDGRPIKPAAAIYWIKTNCTQSALIWRMKELEKIQGRGLMLASEIDDLRFCQSATGGSGAQALILNAHTTPSQWGADRSGVDSVTASTTLSLNIAASSTPLGMQKFFAGGTASGSINRCSVSIVPSTRELPRNEDCDDAWHAALSPYLDNLEAARGEYVCEEIDDMIDELYQEYNTDADLQQRDVIYNLHHRQLLIVKQRAYLLYIAAGGVWTDEMEMYCRWSFYYQRSALLTVFERDILAYEAAQRPLKMTYTVVGPKRSELLDLKATFCLQDLIALRCAKGVSPEAVKSLSQDQIKQWRRRKFIEDVIAPDGTKLLRKTDLWLEKHPEDTNRD